MQDSYEWFKQQDTETRLIVGGFVFGTLAGLIIKFGCC